MLRFTSISYAMRWVWARLTLEQILSNFMLMLLWVIKDSWFITEYEPRGSKFLSHSIFLVWNLELLIQRLQWPIGGFLSNNIRIQIPILDRKDRLDYCPISATADFYQYWRWEEYIILV
ncbi:tRNA-specific 2-thiouridylase MnmA [Bienertia sinuspersici]